MHNMVTEHEIINLQILICRKLSRFIIMRMKTLNMNYLNIKVPLKSLKFQRTLTELNSYSALFFNSVPLKQNNLFTFK